MTVERLTTLRSWLVRLLYLLAMAACVGLILASLQGCGDGPAAGNSNPVTPDCETDADCAIGEELCSAYKVCLPRADGRLAVGIELTPPPDSNVGTDQKLTQIEIPPWSIEYGADGLVRILYPEAVRLTGALRVIDDGGPLDAMQATVTVTRDSRLPGRPKVVVSKIVDALRTYVRPSDQDVAANPDFTLMLPANVTHSLRATPAPPFDELFHPTHLELTLGSDEPLVVMFGEADTTDYLSGVVVDALGAGVAAVQVRATDADTGLMVSNVGLTDDWGEFVLAVPKGQRTYKLTFSPSEDNLFVPETTHGSVTCCEQSGNTLEHPQDVGEFVLPAFPAPKTFQFAFVGIDTSGASVGVVGLAATFETTVGQPGGVTGTYSVTATTDDNGIVTVDLVPGDMAENRSYKVTIITSPTSEFASEVRQELQVGPNGGAGETLSLQRRVPFTGHLSADSPSLEAITIKARRNETVLDGLGGILLTTVTDADGRFNLLLDPGMYTLEIQPPTSIPLPRWALDVPEFVQLDADETVWNAGIISIPSAAVLQVQVDSADGEAHLENISVAAYLIDPACASEAGDPCDYAAMLLGEGITDSDGLVRLIVPNP